ncbi:MAG TPA: site-specific integrase [Burkholderiales bacterium]|nr:site-specific integrase [Burkholderiales bacterium]
MSLRKRGGTWWIDFITPAGERVRCSARTEDKTQAQELHDKLKAEAWRTCKLGEQVKRTWDEAALRWLRETEHKKSHLQDAKQILWLQKFFRGRYISDITRDLIAEVAEKKRQEASASTANRYLAMIRAILRRACLEWEWTERPPRIRLYPEPKRRVRWLTPEQAQRLVSELPEHLAEMARFSLATGLRQRNVAGLEWSQVDVARRSAWIHADQAKGKRSIPVALNDTALAVLNRQARKHPRYVFSYAGRPIRQVSTKAWRNALKRAGIEDFRWHDLRHTWASWLTQNGVPLNALQEMGAWRSTEMVQRYAHLGSEHIARHASVVDNLLGTNPSQGTGTDRGKELQVVE